MVHKNRDIEIVLEWEVLSLNNSVSDKIKIKWKDTSAPTHAHART